MSGALTFEKSRSKRYIACSDDVEVPPRFELGSGAFAELCLTTWLWHRPA